jgi:hypothetical protein
MKIGDKVRVTNKYSEPETQYIIGEEGVITDISPSFMWVTIDESRWVFYADELEVVNESVSQL